MVHGCIVSTGNRARHVELDRVETCKSKTILIVISTIASACMCSLTLLIFLRIPFKWRKQLGEIMPIEGIGMTSSKRMGIVAALITHTPSKMCASLSLVDSSFE
jgi:hypothetical protein